MRGPAAGERGAGVGGAVSVISVEAAGAGWGIGAAPARSAARARVGIPEGVPVVMTGHQAGAWHPGIAVKFLLARAAADAAGGACVWIVPDHVAGQPFRVRAPVVRAGKLGVLEMDLSAPLAEGVGASAAAARAGFEIDWGGAEPALGSVREGVERYARALEGRAGEENAARQATGAMRDVLEEMGGAVRPDAVLYASELGRAGALDELIGWTLEDPRACAEAYNAAARAHAGAGVAELRVGDRVEVPFWKLVGGRALPAFADELGGLDRSAVAPRALAMTAACRLRLCEVFIHGTGGGRYDRVMEEWIRAWRGVEVAPMVAATATRRLPLGELAASEVEIDRAVRRAHAARHDPALLGDEEAAREKRRLVEAVREAKERGGDAATLYQEMQGMLERVRAARGDALAEMEREAREMSARRGEARVAGARDWPVFLYGDEVVRELGAAAQEEARALAGAARVSE